MSKKVKIWLIVAVCLILIGAIIFGGVMTMLNWDFSKLSTVKYETNTYEINEDFAKILITTLEGDVEIVPSDDGKCKVVCYEKKKVKHEVKVDSDQLIIDAYDGRKWYDYINFFSFSTPKITVYLPTDMIRSLYINGSTGDIDISSSFTFKEIDVVTSTGDVNCYASSTGEIKIQVNTGSIYLNSVKTSGLNLSASTGSISATDVICDGKIKTSVSTGDTLLTDVYCRGLISTSRTGEIELTDVISVGYFNIENRTGDIKFLRCDASEIYAKTSTGDIEGTLRSDKIFITETGTGEVDVPKTTNGGRCELTTSTGDIEIDIVYMLYGTPFDN